MKLHHFGIAVQNLQKSLKLYEAMDYKCETNIVNDTDRNINIVFLTNGKTRIELIEKADKNSDSPIDNMLDSRNRHNIYHSCYRVDDLEAEIRRLQKENFVLMIEPAPAIAMNSKRVCFMYNFDIGMIELLEV